MDSLKDIEAGFRDFLAVVEEQLQQAILKINDAGDDALQLLALDKPIGLWRELRNDARDALSRITTVRESEATNRKAEAQEADTKALVDLKDEIYQARTDMAQSGRMDKIQALLISFAMSSKDEALIAQAEAIKAQSPTFHVTGQEKHETTIRDSEVKGDFVAGDKSNG